MTVQSGPVVNAIAMVSLARHAALVAAHQPIPPPVPIHALIDTGASCTCVDPSVLTSLQLSPTGPCMMNTPSSGATPHATQQYDMRLVIPGPSPMHPTLDLRNIPVASAEILIHQGFHALIGRDILRHCMFTYNGSMGLFTLAY